MSYFDAIAAVLALDDISEEDFAKSVHAQACLMAGINPDDLLWHYAD